MSEHDAPAAGGAEQGDELGEIHGGIQAVAQSLAVVTPPDGDDELDDDETTDRAEAGASDGETGL